MFNVPSSPMDLYMHNVVSHAAEFYEKMDFRNASTERYEGFLAFVKRILKYSSNRNLGKAQALREVFVRLHYRDQAMHKDPKRPSSVFSRIDREFSNFEFREIVIPVTDNNRSEVESYTSTLEKHGFLKEESIWVLCDSSLSFSTVAETQRWRKKKN